MCRYKLNSILSFISINNKLIPYRKNSYTEIKKLVRFGCSKENKVFISSYLNVCQRKTSTSAIKPIDINEIDNTNELPKASKRFKMKTIYKYKTDVNHEELVISLSKCSSVKEQIEKLLLLISMTEKDKEERFELAQNIENILKPYFPNSRVELLGSSFSGLGLKGCDVDLAFCTDWLPSMKNEDIKADDLPTVTDINEGRVPLSKISEFSPRYQLRFARQVLSKYCKDISSTMYVVHGRCPVLQFQYGPNHLNCDISYGNSKSLNSTKLVYFIGKLDSRVLTLGKIINYWAKHVVLIGPLERFKSYAFTLLLIYFLQTRNPPVLPPIQEILNKSDFFKHNTPCNFDISNDLLRFPQSKNTQTVDELLHEFFFFYLFFDFRHTICPLKGCMVPKHELQNNISEIEFSTICIQDPLDETWNVTNGTSYKMCNVFMKQMLTTCMLYQDAQIWVPNPPQKWGLAYIIDEVFSKETCEDTCFQFPIAKFNNIGNESVDVQFKKLSETILKILNYALLFHCDIISYENSVSHFKDSKHFSNVSFNLKKIQQNYERTSHSTKKTYLKMICSAINVWQGRCKWNKEQFASNLQSDILELEHTISLNIMKINCDKVKQLEFICECVSSTVNGEVFLNFLLSPVDQKKKISSIAYVFLKDYLSKLIDKI